MKNAAPQQMQQMGQQTQQLGQVVSNAGAVIANNAPNNTRVTEVKGDPLDKGEDFFRVCVRNNGQKAADPRAEAAIEAACNMYVWGVVSGINLYSSISEGDILAAKKRGEAGFSLYGISTADALNKSSATLNLVCIPDEVTVGQLRKIVSKYMTDHLDQTIWSTGNLTYHAVTEAFPCKAPKPSAALAAPTSSVDPQPQHPRQ